MGVVFIVTGIRLYQNTITSAFYFRVFVLLTHLVVFTFTLIQTTIIVTPKGADAGWFRTINFWGSILFFFVVALHALNYYYKVKKKYSGVNYILNLFIFSLLVLISLRIYSFVNYSVFKFYTLKYDITTKSWVEVSDIYYNMALILVFSILVFLFVGESSIIRGRLRLFGMNDDSSRRIIVGRVFGLVMILAQLFRVLVLTFERQLAQSQLLSAAEIVEVMLFVTAFSLAIVLNFVALVLIERISFTHSNIKYLFENGVVGWQLSTFSDDGPQPYSITKEFIKRYQIPEITIKLYSTIAISLSGMNDSFRQSWFVVPYDRDYNFNGINFSFQIHSDTVTDERLKGTVIAVFTILLPKDIPFTFSFIRQIERSIKTLVSSYSDLDALPMNELQGLAEDTLQKLI